VALTKGGEAESPTVSMKAYKPLRGVVLPTGLAKLENGAVIKVGGEFKVGEIIDVGWDWSKNRIAEIKRVGEEIEETEPTEKSIHQNGDIDDVAFYFEENERENSL